MASHPSPIEKTTLSSLKKDGMLNYKLDPKVFLSALSNVIWANIYKEVFLTYPQYPSADFYFNEDGYQKWIKAACRDNIVEVATTLAETINRYHEIILSMASNTSGIIINGNSFNHLTAWKLKDNKYYIYRHRPAKGESPLLQSQTVDDFGALVNNIFQVYSTHYPRLGKMDLSTYNIKDDDETPALEANFLFSWKYGCAYSLDNKILVVNNDCTYQLYSETEGNALLRLLSKGNDVTVRYIHG